MPRGSKVRPLLAAATLQSGPEAPGKKIEQDHQAPTAPPGEIAAKMDEVVAAQLEQWASEDSKLRAHGDAVRTGNAPLKQGQVEFTGLNGHRGVYIIAPEEMEDPQEILMHMFDPNASRGWQLKPPKFMLTGSGGRDHYINWLNTSPSRARVWGNQRDDPDDLFASRMSEIAGGVCKAVTECNGWFDFGQGMRGGMSEVIKDGLKTQWAADGHLAGFKEGTVVFAVRKLQDTHFADEFESSAVNVDDPHSAIHKLPKRMLYPSCNHFLFPEVEDRTKRKADSQLGSMKSMPNLQTDEGESGNSASADVLERLRAELQQLGGKKAPNEVKFKINHRFICNCLTHIIFVRTDHLLQQVQTALKNITTRAIIFANGRRDLIKPGIGGTIVNAAAAGVPIVVLHNTGGAAERLGVALQERALLQPHREYQLPESINTDNFLLLSTRDDTVEKVIDKLTLVLSSVQDDEMREVGYLQAERDRLTRAWQRVVLYRYNANNALWLARLLQYSIIMLGFATTLSATLYTHLLFTSGGPASTLSTSLAISEMDAAQAALVVFTTVLPLLTGLLQVLGGEANGRKATMLTTDHSTGLTASHMCSIVCAGRRLLASISPSFDLLSSRWVLLESVQRCTLTARACRTTGRASASKWTS